MYFDVDFLLTNSAMNAAVRLQLTHTHTLFLRGTNRIAEGILFTHYFILSSMNMQQKGKKVVSFVYCVSLEGRSVQNRLVANSLLSFTFSIFIAVRDFYICVVVPYHHTLGLCWVSTLQQTKTAWICIFFMIVIVVITKLRCINGFSLWYIPLCRINKTHECLEK